MVWVTRKQVTEVSKDQEDLARCCRCSQLTAANRVRAALGGMTLRERKHGLCRLSLDPSTITYGSK